MLWSIGLNQMAAIDGEVYVILYFSCSLKWLNLLRHSRYLFRELKVFCNDNYSHKLQCVVGHVQVYLDEMKKPIKQGTLFMYPGNANMWISRVELDAISFSIEIL